MSLKSILSALQKDSSAKVKETLDAVYTICMEQKERRINDYSYTTIARLGAGRGVPKAQSIRNKTGEKYRILIKAFSDDAAQLPAAKKITNAAGLNWIDEIQNPKHKLLAKIMASELSEARKVVDELVPPNRRIDVFDYKDVANERKAKGHLFTDLEARALSYILSDEFLKKWEFKTTKYGEVTDKNDKIIFKAATIDAIKKALDFLT